MNLESDGSPGALSIAGSECDVISSDFENIRASGSGGAILAVSKSRVTILSSTFKSVISYNFGGVIFAQNSDLSIEGISADDFKNSAIYGFSLSSLLIKNSEFNNGSTYQEGGAISCTGCIEVEISECNFMNNTAILEGGSIYLIGNPDTKDSSPATITNCNFLDNRSNQGGGIHLSNIRSTVEDCEFVRNVAESKGGAVSLVCPGTNRCEYTIKNSKFINNYAEIQGGAISWDDKKPTFESLQFINNTSIYGNDIASYPIMLQVYLNNETIPYERRLEESEYYPVAYRISNIAPGQKVSTEIIMVLVDEYGNIDYSDNDSTSQIFEADTSTTVLSGTTLVVSKLGSYTFNDLTIQHKPGSKSYLKVISDAIDIKKSTTSGDSNPYFDTVYIEVSFRQCEIGETDLGRECKICGPGSYSLDPKDPCKNCPLSATCLGSYIMFPKKGYWRTDQYTDIFYECLNTNSCLGSNNMTSYTGECAVGYIGNLCQACDNGYSRTVENQCGRCPEETVNAIRLVGIMILLIIVCVVMVKTTLKSAYEPSSLHSIYIKIFTNYIQLVMITTQFKLQWPELVLEFLSIHKQSGEMTDQVFSVDCYLTDGSSDAYKQVHFQKLIVLTLSPAILWFISFIFWGVLALKQKSKTYIIREMIATDAILLFLVHPNIIHSSFGIFNCMEIDGKGYYLLDNLNIECWTGKHYTYSMSVALPCILIWIITFPALVIYFLLKNRLKLQEIDNKLRFGFLFNGYRITTFYWEFINMYQKIAIISMSIFLSNLSVNIQALTALLLIIVSLYLQLRIRPFTHEVLNIMEIRGILAANITIYCGLFYLTNEINEGSKYFFFIVIVMVNVLFLSYWLYHLLYAGWEMVKKRVGFLRRRFDKDDGFWEFLIEDPLAKKVVKGDQIMFTLLESNINSRDSIELPANAIDLYKKFIKRPLRSLELPRPGEKTKTHRKLPSVAMTERSFMINQLPGRIYGTSYAKSESNDDEEYILIS